MKMKENHGMDKKTYIGLFVDPKPEIINILTPICRILSLKDKIKNGANYINL